jgi:hypothetical protein
MVDITSILDAGSHNDNDNTIICSRKTCNFVPLITSGRREDRLITYIGGNAPRSSSDLGPLSCPYVLPYYVFEGASPLSSLDTQVPPTDMPTMWLAPISSQSKAACVNELACI